MKKLFLSSSFKDVANLLSPFAGKDLTGKTVTFIPTASLVEKVVFYVEAGKKALEQLGLTVDELEISTAAQADIAHKLKINDYIYVSGGNTFFLLQELKRTGADQIIIEQVNQGKMYIGESAGSMIAAPHIEYAKAMDDHRKAPHLHTFDALNLADCYPLPHHTNFPYKKAVEKIIAAYETTLSLYPISNAQALLIEDERITVANK